MPRELALRQRWCPFDQILKARNPLWTISARFITYVAFNVHLLLQPHSADRFSRNYVREAAREPAPFAHELLKPAEGGNLLIDQREKGPLFNHKHEDRLQCLC